MNFVRSSFHSGIFLLFFYSVALCYYYLLPLLYSVILQYKISFPSNFSVMILTIIVTNIILHSCYFSVKKKVLLPSTAYWPPKKSLIIKAGTEKNPTFNSVMDYSGRKVKKLVLPRVSTIW